MRNNIFISFLLFFVLNSWLFASNQNPENGIYFSETDPNPTRYLSADSATFIDASVYTNYLLATYYQEIDDRESMISELQQAIELKPDDPRLRYELAEAYYRNNDFDQALTVLGKLNQLDAKYASAYLLAGKIYIHLNKPEQALAALSQATTYAPTDWESYIQLAQLLQEENKINEAITVYHQAAAIKPDDFLSQFRLGFLSAQNKNYTDAITYYQRTIQLAPRYLPAYFYLGFIYDITGNITDAASTYQSALIIEPRSPELHYRLGILYQRQKLYENAILELEQTLQLDTTNIQARFALGECYFFNNQLMQAQAQFEQLTTHRRLGIRAQYYLGLIAEMQQNYLIALDRFTTALSLDIYAADKDEAYIHIYQLFKQITNLAGAIDYFKMLLARGNNQPVFYLCLSWAYTDLKQLDNAKSITLEGLTRYPRDEDLIYQMGIIYDRLNDTTNAELMFKKAIEINPKNVDALNYLGYMYAEKGIKLDEAEQYIKQALSLEPNAGYILDSLGWVYYKQGKFDAALIELQKAIAITTTDAVLYDHLGDTYKAKGMIQSALDAWKKALELDPLNESIRKKLESK